MGPYERDCPEPILDLLTPTGHEHALRWRADCRANAAARRARRAKPSPRAGQTIIVTNRSPSPMAGESTGWKSSQSAQPSHDALPRHWLGQSLSHSQHQEPGLPAYRSFAGMSERLLPAGSRLRGAAPGPFSPGDIERERRAGTGFSRRVERERPASSIRSRSPEVPPMDIPVSVAAVAAAPAVVPASPDASAALAQQLPSLDHLALGRAVDAPALRAAMGNAFGGSDAEGAWVWKTAYDACEAATVLFLRKFGPGHARPRRSPAAMLAMLAKVAALAALAYAPLRREPNASAILDADRARLRRCHRRRDHARRSRAGAFRRHRPAGDFRRTCGRRLILNELAETRADLLDRLFPALSVTRLRRRPDPRPSRPRSRPSVVLMNPPFSAAAHVEGRVADAALRHIASALARLAEGGRLVAITGANLSPDNPAWREAFVRFQERGRVVFSAAIDGRVYARHGTTIDTRLTVIDRVARRRSGRLPGFTGHRTDAATLLGMGRQQFRRGRPLPRPALPRRRAFRSAHALGARLRSARRLGSGFSHRTTRRRACL